MQWMLLSAMVPEIWRSLSRGGTGSSREGCVKLGPANLVVMSLMDGVWSVLAVILLGSLARWHWIGVDRNVFRVSEYIHVCIAAANHRSDIVLSSTVDEHLPHFVLAFIRS